MVTTTTKTLNYSITKGNTTNSVNATITSTPGFNSNYLGKVPGILKVLELILAIAVVIMVATLRGQRTLDINPVVLPTTTAAPGVTTTTVASALLVNNTGVSYLREDYMNGEVYFLCANSAVITVLVIILGAYLFHTTSAMIVPKATTVENVANLILALMLLAAGIVEIVMATTQGDTYMKFYSAVNPVTQIPIESSAYYVRTPRMPAENVALRVAAGAIAIVNGLLLLGSFVLSRKELAGPKTL